MPKSHSAADFSSEEHMADVCRAMLICHIDLESARNETIKELKSTIKERDKVIAELETLLSESCAEVKRFLLPKFELSLWVLRPHYLSSANEHEDTVNDVEIVEVLAPPVGQHIISLSDERDIGSDLGSTMNSNSPDPGYNNSKEKEEESLNLKTKNPKQWSWHYNHGQAKASSG